MPNPPPQSLVFEPFIETNEIIVSSKSANDGARSLIWEGCNEWVEITVGVIGKCGEMHSLSPSITVKETGDILSLEEKFQGMFSHAHTENHGSMDVIFYFLAGQFNYIEQHDILYRTARYICFLLYSLFFMITVLS